MAPDNFSVIHKGSIIAAGFAQFRLRNRRRVREQRIYKSSFAGTIAPHQSDFLPTDHTRGEIRDDFGVSVRLTEAFDFENMFAGWPLLFKLQIGTLNVRPRQLGNLQALDFLAPRLHLTGARSGGKPRDELVQLVNLLFALRILRFDLRANLSLRDDHIVISTRVSNDGLVIDIGNVGANAVEEMTIVRNHDQHTPHIDSENS